MKNQIRGLLLISPSVIFLLGYSYLVATNMAVRKTALLILEVSAEILFIALCVLIILVLAITCFKGIGYLFKRNGTK